MKDDFETMKDGSYMVKPYWVNWIWNPFGLRRSVDVPFIFGTSSYFSNGL